MSAETLRRAAWLMRQRAEGATDGPWRVRRGPGEHVVADLGAPLRVADTNRREDSRHIASWHPDVALAVAALLELIARFPSAANHVDVKAALAVANAYLGEPL